MTSAGRSQLSASRLVGFGGSKIWGITARQECWPLPRPSGLFLATCILTPL